MRRTLLLVVVGCLSALLLAGLLRDMRTAPGPENAAPPSPTPVPSVPAGLNVTGSALPRTSYAIPPNATFMAPDGEDDAPGTHDRPVRTLNRALALVAEGGTVVLRGGVYRDWHSRKGGVLPGIVSRSLTLQAYPGEKPWLDGTDVVAAYQWRKVGRSEWRLRWSTPAFCEGRYYERPPARQIVQPNAGPCAHADMSDNPSNPMASDPQMVFVDGVQMRQVPLGDPLNGTSFSYDWRRRQIHLGVNPQEHLVEISARPSAIAFMGRAEVRIRGIGFRRFASNQFSNVTSSAVYAGGRALTVEDSVFTENAAGALAVSKPFDGAVIRRTLFARNGYTALGSNGDSTNDRVTPMLVVDNVFAGNNAEGFGERCTISCGAAAAKFAHMIGLTVTKNVVRGTGGMAHGFWCDLGCSRVRYTYNVVEGHAKSGIFHEVSSDGVVAANVLVGNGVGVTVASATTHVVHNTMVDNELGISVYDDPRRRGSESWDDIGPDTRAVSVVNNVVSGGEAAVVLGASTSRDRPLEVVRTLLSALDFNTYDQRGVKTPVFVEMRTRDGVSVKFNPIELGLLNPAFERNSHWIDALTDPLFVNRVRRDFRIHPASPAFHSSAALTAEVGAAMEVPTTDTSRSRGALVP